MAKNAFNSVLMNRPRRNHFDLSHDRKFSMNMGTLTPIVCMEVLPGDKFSMSTEQMFRFAPLVAPVMHKINVFTHFFFVPNRILWSGWQDFITGGEDGQQNPVHPYIENNGYEIGTIPDYLGVPRIAPVVTPPSGNTRINALPFAAYNAIYNEYYRDQNLQPDTKFQDLEDGDNTQDFLDSGTLGVPYRRAWNHDYFTSALPWAQKGDAVTIPFGDSAPLIFDNSDENPNVGPGAYGRTGMRDATGNLISGSTDRLLGMFDDGSNLPPNDKMMNLDIATQNGVDYANPDVSQTHYVDLENATANTINDLRRAFRLQEWLEKNARGGSRYIESILVHFGVRSSDSRLQRPEYLGGGKSPVVISEVLQTSSSEMDGTPQGNLSGHGISVGKSHSFSRYFEEHGFIIGICSVMPITSYQQGLPRMFSKTDKFDYYWPSFAHIGEQPILNKELYFNNGASAGEDEEVFGYVPRYSELRYIPSSVHGDFKDTLNYWHMGRVFDNTPQLNSEFIECNPTDRIFAVQDLPDSGEGENPVQNYDKLYCHMYHKIHAKRPLPKYGIPSF
jgi:hypothetical protein